MALPTNRTQFVDFCLRKLGQPVINVNVETTQVEDRVDEALQRFFEEHYDATENTWVSYSLTQEDVDNGYITLPDDIMIVTDILSTSDYMESGMFSYNYQVALANISPFQGLDSTNYFMTMTNIDFTRKLTNAEESFDFYRHTNKLYLRSTDLNSLGVGNVVLMKAHVMIPESNTNIWSDRWLKNYATSLIKQQWGTNMKKHGEVQLLGGVTINGQQIYDEATEEIRNLEEELSTRYTETVGFIIG